MRRFASRKLLFLKPVSRRMRDPAAKYAVEKYI
jgi:hypothetical protein